MLGVEFYAILGDILNDKEFVLYHNLKDIIMPAPAHIISDIFALCMP